MKLTKTKKLEQFIVFSELIEDDFEITVYLPEGYDESNEKYPVVYLLDSNVFFNIVQGTSHLLQVAGEIPPMILVGIGYQDGSRHLELRDRDLLPSHNEESHLSGGAGLFYDFLVNNLKGTIEKKYRVDLEFSVLAGDSYSGLFALYAMFQYPQAFQSFIIGSPSIYWDDCFILSLEEEYAKTYQDLKAHVFLSVGELEAIYEPSFARMVGNVNDLYKKLESRNYKGLKMDMNIFENETHMSVIPSIMSRGLRVVFNSEKMNTHE